jgi:hypothetical protein
VVVPPHLPAAMSSGVQQVPLKAIVGAWQPLDVGETQVPFPSKS